MTTAERSTLLSGALQAVLWGGAAGVGVHPLAGALAGLGAFFASAGVRLPWSLACHGCSAALGGVKGIGGLASARVPVKVVVPLLLLSALGGRGCEGITLPPLPDIDWPDVVPDIDLTPEPPPIAAKGVLFVTETENATQPAAFASLLVREYLDSKGVEYRLWDEDLAGDELANGPVALREALRVAKQTEGYKPPWVVLSNGKTGYTGPAPLSPDEMLTLLRKYLGEGE